MRALRCPRCHRESADPLAAFCRACGAPLRLAEEPSPAPLTAPVAIDRRAEEAAELDLTRADAVRSPLRPEPRPSAPPPPRDELADVERSVRDLGNPLLTAPEPPLPPPPTPAPATPRRPPATAAGPATVPAAPARPPPPATAKSSASPSPSKTPASTVHPQFTQPAAPRPHVHGPAPTEVPGHAPPPLGALEVHVRRAEPWRRAAAWAIDALPFAASGVALARSLVRQASGAAASGADLLDFVARERVIVLSVAAAIAVALGVYATLAHALAGATLGKRLLGLRVVGPDGERPALARSALRSAVAIVSASALGLGFLIALFTRSGRALHDLLARTWVVDAQS